MKSMDNSLNRVENDLHRYKREDISFHIDIFKQRVVGRLCVAWVVRVTQFMLVALLETEGLGCGFLKSHAENNQQNVEWLFLQSSCAINFSCPSY